jgi:glycosyltransferase involved in cell wall biosynthesis
MRRLLYLGNNLTAKTRYYSTMELLYQKLHGEGYEIKIESDELFKIKRLWKMIQAILRNRREVDYILIDTFSTTNFYFALICSQLARLLNIKYIPILRGGNLPSRLKNSPILSRVIFEKSYLNVAPSNYLRDSFEQNSFNTMYIPNILDIKMYPFVLRKKIEPKLLYVRSFAQLYNPQMAIKVLSRLKSNFPKAKLCMVGPVKDDSFEECQELAEQLGLTKDIEFTGVLSKSDWHEKAKDFDIFINTTNFDNTPVSVMEAMALGLPVVSTNVGGMPYLINNEIDGILVERNSIEEMTKAIERLMSSPDYAMEVSKKARKKVEMFDWQHVRSKWNDILK